MMAHCHSNIRHELTCVHCVDPAVIKDFTQKYLGASSQQAQGLIRVGKLLIGQHG